jgi:hypothetical protein
MPNCGEIMQEVQRVARCRDTRNRWFSTVVSVFSILWPECQKCHQSSEKHGTFELFTVICQIFLRKGLFPGHKSLALAQRHCHRHLGGSTLLIDDCDGFQ